MPQLQDYKPFSQLSAAAKADLRDGRISQHDAAATPLLVKGQRVSGAYFVLAGRLRVYSLAPNGNEATLYCIAPGETCVFALNSLFNDLLYPAWVQAVEPTTLALIPGPLYHRLFAAEAVIRDLTVHTLSTLVFRLMAELEEVHSYKLGQRLANLLLVRASGDGELRMTQQQIACHLGTSREVVARLIGELVDSGLVETGRGRIRIRNAPALSALINGQAERSG